MPKRARTRGRCSTAPRRALSVWSAHEITKGALLRGRNFFFSSRRRHTIFGCDWSSDVCSSDLRASTQRVPAPVIYLDEARRSVTNLRGATGGKSLAQALAALTREFTSDSGIRVTFDS